MEFMVDVDFVMIGIVFIVDDVWLMVEVIVVVDGWVIVVGDWFEVVGLVGVNIWVIDLGVGCVMLGFVEVYGYLLLEVVVLLDWFVDICLVMMWDVDDVVVVICGEVVWCGLVGVYLVGWDLLL